jgi:short-subunit dehydrogenase
MKHKVIMITGASDGIGKQISLRLAKDGWTLLLLGRDKKRLKSVQEQVDRIFPSDHEAMICDLRVIENIRKLSDELKQKYQLIDGLVNDAGIWQKTGQLESIDDDVVLDTLNTNLSGLILLTKAVLPLIRKSELGSIINIVSRSGYMAQAGQSVYTASKYGVRGFSEVLREDLRASSVRVAAIFQGGTNTDMFKKAGEIIPEEKYASFIPPEGIAETVAFMVSLPANIWLPEVKIETK